VWSALVGGAHISFYRQWAAAGMHKSIPMASTTFAVGNEHIVLSPEECNGMLICYNYFQDLKNPVNAAFVANFHKRFGADYPNITELAMGTYQGFRLWAEGVKKAGSIDRLKGHRTRWKPGSASMPPPARSRSIRRHIIVSSTFISPKSATRNSMCWRISPSRSPPTPPRYAI